LNVICTYVLYVLYVTTNEIIKNLKLDKLQYITVNSCIFRLNEQFFSYMYLAGHHCRLEDCKFRPTCMLSTYSCSEGSFMCHTYCDMGPPFLRSYPKDLWFSLLNAVLLMKEQSLPILKVLGLTWLVPAGLELTTSQLLTKSTTTRLQQPVPDFLVKFPLD
jgi:hypothetical protein